MASDSLGEFFVLRQAGHLLGKVSEPAALARARRQTLQERRAAEALWSASHAAEGLRLMQKAHGSLRQVLKATANGSATEQGLEAELSAVGLRNASALVVTFDRIRDAAVPALDKDIDDEHASLFADALKLHVQVVNKIDYALLTDTERRLHQLSRTAGAVTVVAATVMLSLWLHHKLARDAVSASASFRNSPTYAPVMAADGDERTEWVLPDQLQGWIQLALPRATDVRGVRVLNGHNPPHNDRAAKKVRVTLTDKDGVKVWADHTFPEFRDVPEWALVNVALTHVVSVRIDVQEYFRKGGALAEIEVVSD